LVGCAHVQFPTIPGQNHQSTRQEHLAHRGYAEEVSGRFSHARWVFIGRIYPGKNRSTLVPGVADHLPYIDFSFFMDGSMIPPLSAGEDSAGFGSITISSFSFVMAVLLSAYSIFYFKSASSIAG
jgi:hypothetical protein